MTVTDKEKTAPSGTVPTGSGVARELAASGALDDLFEQARVRQGGCSLVLTGCCRRC
ncbi:Hypothetical protein AAM4_1081 [Actinomyces succiniciruminis]|uniref:Uncharacterized protein n=1 Tax=Actinomyces succiniciruminis TaxID=1522002 RepID=A0A1L7RP66_9ACTO|nr:Hypothetical protein AAM4_1081 [Actinomyces succiniciruminis]